MKPMENTNKMKNLTNDLKAFEQMMKEQRKENSYPEIEFEIDTEEDSTADILAFLCPFPADPHANIRIDGCIPAKVR